jgi:hypothetical protein
MTILYQTLALQYLSTNPTPTTLNISSGDTIELGIDTSSYADGNGWTRYGTPIGCTTSSTVGADGEAVVITPTVGATSYSVIFRTLISETSTYYYGRIAGTISSGVPDTTPNAFTFTDQTGVALNSTIISNTITVSGINAASAISISGGTYSINGGAYTSSSGTVTNGQTVSVAHTSSGSNSTAVNTTLTIGGVSDTFTSTTASAPGYAINFYDPSYNPKTTFNEGEQVFVFINTTSVPDGTTLYWSTSSSSDLVAPVNGSFVVSYSFISTTLTIATDSLTEGTESLTFYLRSGSVSGTVLASSSITINDTSTTPAATYSVANASTNEGSSATANVTTTNVANGTTLYWTVNATTADVSTASGSFTISANAGSFTIPAIADSTTEGAEYYTISVRTGSTAGTVVATSTLTINDTSTTPVSTYSVASASTNEGASATANVTTTNVTNGTTLYWTVNATTADVSTTSGSFTISGNAGSFTIPAIADSTTEGTEYYTISVRTGSTAGTVVATSTLTINDTSTTPAADTTPDAFSFTNQTGVPLSTLTSSNEVQIFGINTGAPISISGGEYSIALDPTTYTAFTSSAGTIYNGQSIKVRHTSSANTSTNTSTTLTIGGVQATFTSTTTSVIPAVYGMRIYDASGNITLDTTDETMKDLGVFTANSITANQSILGVPLTTNSIALVNNNNGDTNTSIASAVVSLNISTSSITVSGGAAGFDISIRMMEF